MVDSNLSYQYEGDDYGNVEFPDQTLDQQAVDSVLGVASDTNTMTGLPLPSPASINVAVENGTGISGQAATTAAALGRLGYRVVSTGDVTPVGPESETLVEYDSHSPSVEADAERVVRSLSGAAIMAFAPTPPGVQVAVITGSDFSVVVPSTARVQSPQGSSATTTSSAPATTAPATTTPTGTAGPVQNTGSDQLEAPSPAASPLAPFDPRSCTASGGEGP
jgi:hypothetical protein